MIANAKEREITARWAARFEDSLRKLRASGVGDDDPIFYRARCDGLESEAETLRYQLREYEERIKAREDARCQASMTPSSVGWAR